jgi:hypothetical protein
LISDTELKHRLGLIVAQEEAQDVDWDLVARLCDELAADVGIDAPLLVQEYLASFGQRQSDSVFAHSQRSRLVDYLRGR